MFLDKRRSPRLQTINSPVSSPQLLAMKNLISTLTLTAGAFTLATASASAQAQVWSLPTGFTAHNLSPDGIWVSGNDAVGSQMWNPSGMLAIPGSTDSWGGEISIGGQRFVGRFPDPVTVVDGPGFFDQGVGVTSLGWPSALFGDLCFTSTVESLNYDGSIMSGVAENGCNYFPFRWTQTGGYQLLDTTSLIVPTAKPSARALATSGDGAFSAGWIQTSARSGSVWDAAGVLSFPMITPGNPEGNGEIYGLDGDGDVVVGSSYSDGPVVIDSTGIHSPAVEAGYGNSGGGMLGLNAGGTVAVGNGGGAPGPFGTPDFPLIWTAWGGGQDMNAFFNGYGITLPTGNPIHRAVDISADGLTFLVQQAPPFFGYGDAFMIQLPNSWSNLGGASAGSNGMPFLEGAGYLTPGAPARIAIADAASSSISFVAVAGTSNPFPVWGGVLHTLSYSLLLPIPTDAAGSAKMDVTWPVGFAPGATLYIQAVNLDAGVVDGLTLTNAISATGF